MRLEYLQVLFRVIQESTVCLMGHERRLTLLMVYRLRQHLEYNLYCGGDMAAVPPTAPHQQHYLHPSSAYGPPQYRYQPHHHHHVPVISYQSRNNRAQQFDNISTAGSTASVPSVSETTSDNGSEVGQVSGLPQAYTPRQTLLYLPRGANRWVAVS
jgi:hypothetical protein